ncbi:MAG: hypothetical protein ACLQQB_06135 [Solirubrobacteraceae bacterium]
MRSDIFEHATAGDHRGRAPLVLRRTTQLARVVLETGRLVQT